MGESKWVLLMTNKNAVLLQAGEMAEIDLSKIKA
jgi:hypothetical protein